MTRIYNRAFMIGSDPYAPIKEEHMLQILLQPRCIVLVAYGYGSMLGFIILDFEEEKENKYAIIVGLGTDPSWRKRGIARYLCYEAWNYLRNLNIKEIRCEVYEKNAPSYALIKSLDFVEYDRKTYMF